MEDANAIGQAKTMLSCKADWQLSLPSIVGEDQGDEFSIEILFGTMEEFIEY